MWLWLKNVMGYGNSSYLEELSDDEDDDDFDYSLERRDNEPKSCINDNAKSNIAAVSTFPTSDIVTTDVQVLDSSKGEMNLTTDASASGQTFRNPQLALHLESTLDVEKNLDYYEMVSLVYLLYEDPNFALQELTLLFRGAEKHLLNNWAHLEECHGKPWQKKLVEALCIIKNFQELSKLGYNKHDVNMHYLPHLPNAATNLNPMKKIIYLLCEKLNNEKTNTFLETIKADFEAKGMNFPEYDKEYLELYFLDWEISGYITMKDLSNIKRALKVMEEETLQDMLDTSSAPINEKIDKKEEVERKQEESLQISATPPQPVEKKHIKRSPSTSTDTHRLTVNSGESSADFQSPPPSMGQDNVPYLNENEDNDVYEIDPANPGIILIVNQEEFFTAVEEEYLNLLPTDIKRNKLESRKGTEKDKLKLEETFTRFGFKVIVCENLTHLELIEKIKQVVRNVRNESSLFVCILSHGDKGVVYGVNSCKVKVSEIQEIMCGNNKQNLTGKPKILILQSCQGKQCQTINECPSEDEDEYESYSMTTDGPSSSRQSRHRIMDILTFWATVRGYAAIRNKNSGSWFIQTLCDKLIKFGNSRHFADICTKIVSDVTDKIWVVDKNEKNAMTPLVESTLRKSLYLPPLRDVQQ